MLNIKKVISFIFECEFRVVAVLSLFFLLGIFFGSFYSCRLEMSSELVNSMISDNLLSVFIKNLLLLSAVFLLGYTVLGTPLIFFIIIYSGVSCGLFLGTFCAFYGFRGALVASLCFYLFYFINFVSIIYVYFSSLRLSIALYNVFKNNTRYVSPSIYSKPHILKFSIFAVFLLVSSLYYVYIARGLALHFI